MSKIGIIGWGWLGISLGKALIKNDFKIVETKTTEKGIIKLNNYNIEGILFRINGEKIIGETDFMKSIDQLIVSIPPSIKKYYIKISKKLI